MPVDSLAAESCKAMSQLYTVFAEIFVKFLLF